MVTIQRYNRSLTMFAIKQINTLKFEKGKHSQTTSHNVTKLSDEQEKKTFIR